MGYSFHRAEPSKEYYLTDTGELERIPPPPTPLRFTPLRRSKIEVTQQVKDALARASAGIPSREPIKPEPGMIVLDRSALAKSVLVSISALHGTDVKTLKGGSRARRYVESRALFAVLMRKADPMKYSYPTLGRMLGDRDHSTIINLTDKWDIYTARRPELLDHFDLLWGSMQGA